MCVFLLGISGDFSRYGKVITVPNINKTYIVLFFQPQYPVCLYCVMNKEQFKQIREQLNETQAQFAKRLGYKTWSTISYKENGHQPITNRDELMLREHAHILDKKNPSEEG